MLRKFLVSLIVSILLAGAVASSTPLPVIAVMGVVSFFAVSLSDVHNETGDGKPKNEKT